MRQWADTKKPPNVKNRVADCLIAKRSTSLSEYTLGAYIETLLNISLFDVFCNGYQKGACCNEKAN